MNLIEVKDLRKVYRIDQERVVALNRVNLAIGEGEVCCILGTSGSGKSTLLNIMAGLEKPTRGQQCDLQRRPDQRIIPSNHRIDQNANKQH